MLAPRHRGRMPIVKKAKHLRPVEARDWSAGGGRIPLPSAARMAVHSDRGAVHGSVGVPRHGSR
jgi:hypothetical protein